MSAQNNGESETKLAPLTPQRFIQIDDEGYLKFDELRVADAESGREWLASITLNEQGTVHAMISGQAVIVEAFDEPYVALDIEQVEGLIWQITLPYGHKEKTELNSLTLDEWDRFHGKTERGIPFVLSRSAQARFFNLLDGYEDDAIIVDGQTLKIKDWLRGSEDVEAPTWWTEKYHEGAPWDLGAPVPALLKLVPQLKLQRTRVLVLGAGAGHDAAWFASQGHLVTAVDFSDEAVARARAKYGHLENLKIEQADVFKLPESFQGNFDLVIDHTLYCAIHPSRRAELVKVWKRVLAERGHLLGVFFATNRTKGPPYGGSEWELRARLDKSFRMLYWMRLRAEQTLRPGQELLIYAQKLSAF